MTTENQPSVNEEQKEHADEKPATNRTREFLTNLADDKGHMKDADVNTVRFNFRYQLGQVADIIARLQKLSGDDAAEPPVDAFSTGCSRAADELIYGIFKDTMNEILLYSAGPDSHDLPF